MKKSVIRCAILAIIIEVFLFNISSFLSLGNHKEIVTNTYSVDGAEFQAESGFYVATNPQVILYAGGIEKEVHDIYLGVDFENEIVPYSMNVSDEGSIATAYSLGTQYILQWSDWSKYIRIHPYGKLLTNKIIFEVTPGKSFRINEIAYNPVRHLRVRPLRVIVLFLLFYGFALFRCKDSNHQIGDAFRGKRTYRVLATSVFVALGVAAVLFLNLRCGGYWREFAYVTEYNDLAESLSKGHFYLDYPISESLQNTPNPYDFSYRDVNEVKYYWDTAYYNGKYYCYFGITPVLLLYLPYLLLTGNALNNVVAACVFSVLVWLGAVWLVKELLIRYFKNVQYWVWPLFSVLLGFSVQLVYLYQRPDLYDIPILAGNAFSLIGLASWLHGLRSTKKRLYFVLGSACIALVAGCRPQMELIVFLAIPVFYNELIKKSDDRKYNWKKYGPAIILPFVIFALFIMGYNYARFGSVIDFGANYNLTTNDMTKRGFHIDRLGSGIFSFLLQLPSLLGIFPFMIRSNVASEYTGKVIAENIYGGVLATNIITWVVLLIPYMKNRFTNRAAKLLVFSNLLLGGILVCVDATIAGVLQRYMADFALFFVIPALLLCGILLEQFATERRTLYSILAMFCWGALLYTLLLGFSTVCIQLREYQLDNRTLILYHELRSYFILQ